MKWAQTHEVGPALFELHITPNNFHHVGACEQFLNKGLGDGHDRIVETSATPGHIPPRPGV